MALPERGAVSRTNRREYLFVFVALAVLTGLEVTVAQFPGIARRAMVAALVVLAVSKASLICLFFMHLKYETRVLKLTVIVPLLTPAVYALALISDAAWRLVR